MSNGGFARIKYYRGQMLTARDFEDQQEYHRGKQKLLLRRFPPGIIGGLVVTCQPKGSDPDDFDGFLIGEGLAVDPAGNELVVPEGGLKVPADEFKPETPYLGLAYEQTEESVGEDPCGGAPKNNRIVEGVKHSWDSIPNMGPNVTVALIQLKDVKDPGTTCDKYNDPMKPVVGVGDPPVRKNARVVDTEEITDGAITERKIRIGAVTAERLAPNAVVTDKILNMAVTDDKLAPNAVTTDKLQNGSVTADKLANNAVFTDSIQNGAVTPDKLAEGAVTATKLAADSVARENIKDGAVTADELARDAVSTDNIQNQAVTADKIADINVTGGKIADGAVTSAKLAPNAVTTLKIADANVTADKLAPNSVTADKIPAGAVGRDQIANNAVDALRLADGNVTNLKLADNAVTNNKLAPNAVTTLKIADANVTADKLANNSVVNEKIRDGAVTSLKLRLINQRSIGTINPGLTVTVQPPPTVPQNSIIHVVPTSAGTLSWDFTVSGDPSGDPSGAVTYNITIKNHSLDRAVSYAVREIAFG